MEHESCGLGNANTFEADEQRKATNVITAKRMYTRKSNDHGSVVKANARLEREASDGERENSI